MSLPTFLILGRPNVGKSTLFNALNGSRRSIVGDLPGVTRDLIFGLCEYGKHHYILVDSGGVFFHETENSGLPFQGEIEKRVKDALLIADKLFYVVDTRDGLTPYDEVIANALMPFKDKVILMANKTDHEKLHIQASDFYQLGFDGLYMVSAAQKQGLDEVLDHCFETLPAIKQGFNQVETEAIPVSIVGKPNVGKSSILNALAGEDRVIVSEVPGTTRDATDHILTFHGQDFLFVDTAGFRRKSKITDDIDFYSTVRTLRSIANSSVTLLVLDATQGIGDMEQHIANLVEEEGNGIVIVVNKWDTVEEKDSNTIDRYTEYVRRKLVFLEYAPIIFVSAVTKKRLYSLYDLITAVYSNRHKHVPHKDLNDFMKRLSERSQQPLLNSGKGRVHYLRQDKSVDYPKFLAFVNRVEVFKTPFTRYIVKQIREAFGYLGCPVHMEYHDGRDAKGIKQPIQELKKKVVRRSTVRRKK